MHLGAFAIAVLGAGPAGYVAAIRAAQLGARVALIEERDLGGTCLNVGCIPTKTLLAGADLLHSLENAKEFGIEIEGLRFDYAKMKARKESVIASLRNNLERLLRSHKIEIIRGRASFQNAHEIKIEKEGRYQTLQADKVILATGSSPKISAPFLYDGQRIHDSTSILEIDCLPKHLAIVGGGYIGCEFASLFSRLGVQITLIEALDHLIGSECPESRQLLENSFEKRGITILKKRRILSQTTTENAVRLELEGGLRVESESLLVAVGRRFNSEHLKLERAGLSTDVRGAIPVDENMQTAVLGIYAIGDITGRWLLAHTASHDGLVAASHASGQKSSLPSYAIPAVIFTDPEIASVGYTLEKAIALGWEATLERFPFASLGKAQAMNQTEGFAQIVIEKRTGRLLGAQVAGHMAGALIAEISLALQNELTLDCLAETIHAHPTLSEIWMELALLAKGTPLHSLLQKKLPQRVPAQEESFRQEGESSG